MKISRNDTLRELKCVCKIKNRKPSVRLALALMQSTQEYNYYKRQCDRLFGKRRKTL
jgi:hypothetical protein